MSKIKISIATDRAIFHTSAIIKKFQNKSIIDVLVIQRTSGRLARVRVSKVQVWIKRSEITKCYFIAK